MNGAVESDEADFCPRVSGEPLAHTRAEENVRSVSGGRREGTRKEWRRSAVDVRVDVVQHRLTEDFQVARLHRVVRHVQDEEVHGRLRRPQLRGGGHRVEKNVIKRKKIIKNQCTT